MITRNILFMLSLVIASFSSIDVQAQVSSGGNMIVAENGSLFIVGKHSFAKGSGFITPGIIKTSRTGAKGYVNFSKGSSWTGATKGRFVNGYVRVTHDQAFVFPIGDNNKYRPVASSGAINTSAAYYNESPAKGLSNMEKGLTRVSDKEYWDISGNASTKLSFVWGEESAIENITRGQMEGLTLVGWKNSQWEIIPSLVESNIASHLEETPKEVISKSDFSRGVISTAKEVIPSDYKYITVGALKDAGALLSDSEIVSIYPNPVAQDVYVDIQKLGGGKGEIKIYDMDGKEMVKRAIDSQSEPIQHFDASNFGNGLYKLYIKVNKRGVTQKFMVGRM